MANFESIVRPFQTPVYTPPRRPQTSIGVTSGGPQSITIGGTANPGDQLALTISSAAIAGSPVTVTFTLGGGDTLATAALGLVAAVNADANLLAAGITASIVPTQPLQITVSQPTSLNPQATFSSSTTGTTTMTLASGNVQIAAGRRGQVKTLNGSRSFSSTSYNKKWPKETTLADALAGNVPAT